MNAAASIVIPTRDRPEELRQLLRSLQAQSVALDVVVMDDGNDDAAQGVVSGEFPDVRYFRLASDRGPAFQRNRGIELATAPIVFPVDDDTLFVSTRTVEQTLREFDSPLVGAVAMPYINVRQDGIVRQRAATAGGLSVTNTYVGAAHALRRDVFMALGGYREAFFYMGEEGDFCIRLCDAGYLVRLGSADPIHHLESPIRNFARADYLGSRNQVLFVWHNVPMPFVIPHMLITTAHILLHSIVPARLWRRFRGVGEAFWTILSGKARRDPVRAIAYRAFRFLGRTPALASEVHGKFPGLRH